MNMQLPGGVQHVGYAILWCHTQVRSELMTSQLLSGGVGAGKSNLKSRWLWARSRLWLRTDWRLDFNLCELNSEPPPVKCELSQRCLQLAPLLWRSPRSHTTVWIKNVSLLSFHLFIWFFSSNYYSMMAQSPNDRWYPVSQISVLMWCTNYKHITVTHGF